MQAAELHTVPDPFRYKLIEHELHAKMMWLHKVLSKRVLDVTWTLNETK